MGERVWAPQQRSFLPLAQFDDSTLADKSAAASSGRRGRGSPAKSKVINRSYRTCDLPFYVCTPGDQGIGSVQWRCSDKQ